MSGAGQRYVVGEFGGHGAASETVFTVGTAAVRVLENDPDRVMFLVSNTGTGPVYLSTSPGITAPGGVTVQGSGGSMEVDVRSDATFVTHEWWAISASGNQALTVFVARVFDTAKPAGAGD